LKPETKYTDWPPLPYVEEGQWWSLGQHKLFCGDTTSEGFRDALSRVPGGIGLAFADPPYGVNVDEWDGELFWDHDWLSDVADFVIVTPGTTHLDLFFREKTRMPYRWTFAGYITNGCGRGKTGFANWIPAVLFSRPEIKVYKGKQDHFTFPLRSNLTDACPHKGRKPREFVAWLVGLYGVQGKAVVDPFAGTGTTLIVCEELGFRCITGEISPEYCGRIIRRWESFTGETATPIK
jgi:DNA modification methylase